jgi:hypothetical protein
MGGLFNKIIKETFRPFERRIRQAIREETRWKQPSPSPPSSYEETVSSRAEVIALRKEIVALRAALRTGMAEAREYARLSIYNQMAMELGGKEACVYLPNMYGDSIAAALKTPRAMYAPPALSVITICKNIRDGIKDTCQSIANQTFGDFEWIVVDGASVDGTLDILDKYRKYMNHFVSEPDGGIYEAANKGIGLARGEYLLFLHGGDYLCGADVLKNIFGAGMYGDVVYGGEYFLRTEDGELVPRPDLPDPECLDLPFFYHVNVLYHQSTFIRKDLFRRFGLYNEDYRLVSDWEKWIIFLVNGCEFRKIPDFVSVFRQNGFTFNPNSRQLFDREIASVRYNFRAAFRGIDIFGKNP